MLSGKLKKTQHIIYAAYDCLFWKRKVEENYYGIRKEEYLILRLQEFSFTA